MPYIQDLYEGQPETGVTILAINVGEDLAEVEEFLKERNLTFPVLLDISGTVAKKYNIRAIPASYFIDGDGIVRDMQIGAFRNVAEIKDILSQISP
jgi:peroxiredoxin